jgi:riboflavin synthase
MFTGIIEEIGTINKITKNNFSLLLEIKANKVLKDTKIGDSISTNGVCLTVTSLNNNLFTTDVMETTLKSSNLGELMIGSNVNLERAAQLNTRLGGHLVSGHIDGVGKVFKIENKDIAKIIHIKVPKEIIKYIIQKGSVAINGISLTIQDVKKESFQISLIPQTILETNLKNIKNNDTINIEVDMLMKFTERLLNFSKQNINLNYLIENGFLS